MTSNPDRPGSPLGGLRVGLASASATTQAEHLPFEIRQLRGSQAVVAGHGTLGHTVGLPPGTYTVSAFTPDGQVLTVPSAVTVEAERTADVLLELAPSADVGGDPDEAVPASSTGPTGVLAQQVQEQLQEQSPSWLHKLWTAVAAPIARVVLGHVQQAVDAAWLQEILSAQIMRLSSFESVQQMKDSLLNPSGPRARLIKMSWDAFSPDQGPKLEEESATLALRLGPMTVLGVQEENCCVEVEDAQTHRLIAAVPYEKGGYSFVACFRDTDTSTAGEKLRIEFYFADSDTNLLFGYMSRGNFPQAGSMATAVLAAYEAQQQRKGRNESQPPKDATESPERKDGSEPQRLKKAKPPTTLATLLSCYVLLRENELGPLRGFLAKQPRRWSQSPDAAAIRIETYARLGRHEEAAKLCAAAPALGVPSIASGIAYVKQRIRQYIEAATDPASDGQPDDKTFMPSPELTEKLKAAWKTFGPVGAALDLRTLVTAIRVRASTET
jgi:hypothetical protein